jgi:hypothetical protein
MTQGGKRLIAAAAGGVLVVGAIFLAARHGRVGGGRAAGDGDDGRESPAQRWRGFAAGVPWISDLDGAGAPGAPGATGGPAAAKATEVKELMTTWRNAILSKDADTVVAVDGAFAREPRRYMGALVESAGTDDNERVRAFSTRVLGKLRSPLLGEVFAHLLEDPSPYVRQNAAWALGELGALPGGREAAQRAEAELRRLEQQDAARDVRLAANTALKRLQ